VFLFFLKGMHYIQPDPIRRNDKIETNAHSN
jgi:hypothetical protein